MHKIFSCHEPASPQPYTLSLHDALPIFGGAALGVDARLVQVVVILAVERQAGLEQQLRRQRRGDRKSTRLNSSHVESSYAVFCLKKKTQNEPKRQKI